MRLQSSTFLICFAVFVVNFNSFLLEMDQIFPFIYPSNKQGFFSSVFFNNQGKLKKLTIADQLSSHDGGWGGLSALSVMATKRTL